MSTKNTTLAVLVVLIVGAIGYSTFFKASPVPLEELDSTPRNVTLSGTYVCLPRLDQSGPQTDECTFGLKTDDGVYYAVNFGASGTAMEQFMSGKHITAGGFVVIKEALSSDQWAKYDMKGIFTITDMQEVI